MGDKKTLTDKLKNIVRQISGKLEDFEGSLYPESMIIGSGILYCLSADNKTFVKVERGISVYIVTHNYDTQGRSLVYTVHGDIIVIDPEELKEIGFD
ncbi:MAG TPA: hypothetical protein DEG69_19465 [Flavobacteriaceae bacterium]|nr:hypothetical protein [Flavobacteriaceae bacterium]